MVSVTNRAAAVLAQTLRDGDATKDLGFRVVQSGPGEIGLAIDEPRAGDHIVRHDEQTVLLIDGRVACALDGAILDIELEEDGASLTLYGSRFSGYAN